MFSNGAKTGLVLILTQYKLIHKEQQAAQLELYEAAAFMGMPLIARLPAATIATLLNYTK